MTGNETKPSRARFGAVNSLVSSSSASTMARGTWRATHSLAERRSEEHKQ
jgi:hypothetical protein